MMVTNLVSKTVLLFVAFATFGASSFAQVSLTLSSATAAANGAVTLNLTIASPSGSEPAAIQWSITYPVSNIVSIAASAGPALTSAGKTLYCAGLAGNYTCVAAGINTNVIGNGSVATIAMVMGVDVTATAIGLSGAVGALPAGLAIQVATTGGTVLGGALPSTVTLAPTSLTFAKQLVNTTSAAQTITVTNSGPNPLTLASVTIAGTNQTDFVQTNNCPISPNTLAVNSSCNVSVIFTPQSATSFSAVVTITDNGVNSPQSVGLSGTGVVPTWPNGYEYQATFTVAAGEMPGAQTNFPVLVSGTFADFATIPNGGKVANTCIQTVGNNPIAVPCDLIFSSDPAGSMPLPWEFETYNAATGAVNIWVKVPAIGDGTVIYGWYGKPAVTTLQTTPSATWSPNFEAVYHLSENPAGAAPQLNDSTANANHATMLGTVVSSQQQPGVIGGCVNFEGNTYATLANAVNFSYARADAFSLSGWFKLPSGQASYSSTLLSEFPSIQNASWALVQGPNGPTPSAFGVALIGDEGNNRQLADTPGVATGVWHYLVATYSGSDNVAGVQIFVDGVSQPLTQLNNTLNASTTDTLTPQINGRNGGFELSTDSMDEIRMSAKGVVLSPGWVIASYNNQSNPGAFFIIATGLTN